jgi:hypothetical protein
MWLLPVELTIYAVTESLHHYPVYPLVGKVPPQDLAIGACVVE